MFERDDRSQDHQHEGDPSQLLQFGFPVAPVFGDGAELAADFFLALFFAGETMVLALEGDELGLGELPAAAGAANSLPPLFVGAVAIFAPIAQAVLEAR